MHPCVEYTVGTKIHVKSRGESLRHTPCAKLCVAAQRADCLDLQVARALRNGDQIKPNPDLAPGRQGHVLLEPLEPAQLS